MRGKCVCAEGWRGKDCGVDICPKGCSGSHGKCVDGDCKCMIGWKGRDCEESTCPGALAGGVECSGHGRCDVNHLHEVKCICEKAYKGIDCAIAKNSTAGRRECASRLCTSEVHGRCASDDEGPCVCNPGWAGADCAKLLCPKSCSGNGFCTDAGCRCYDGFRGEDCATPICPNACSNHGQCIRGDCQCNPGWADRDCSLQVNLRRRSAEALDLPR